MHGRRFARLIPPALALLVAALALAGCAGSVTAGHPSNTTSPPTPTATPQPLWQFVWVNTDADQSESPQSAYAASA